jgi:hypothetical protein
LKIAREAKMRERGLRDGGMSTAVVLMVLPIAIVVAYFGFRKVDEAMQRGRNVADATTLVDAKDLVAMYAQCPVCDGSAPFVSIRTVRGDPFGQVPGARDSGDQTCTDGGQAFPCSKLKGNFVVRARCAGSTVVFEAAATLLSGGTARHQNDLTHQQLKWTALFTAAEPLSAQCQSAGGAVAGGHICATGYAPPTATPTYDPASMMMTGYEPSRGGPTPTPVPVDPCDPSQFRQLPSTDGALAVTDIYGQAVTGTGSGVTASDAYINQMYQNYYSTSTLVSTSYETMP